MASVGNGEFEFIKRDDRVMYATAHQAINQLELWNFMKEDPGSKGFMFSGAPEVKQIYKKIEELGYDGHSGGSFGCIMRSMQYIAENGYDKFKEEYIGNTTG
jgi:hypothetical protein